jgi:pyruvate, water dikinase
VNPDEFIVFKPTLRLGARPIVQKKLGSKELRMCYNTEGTIPTKNVPTAVEDRARFCITDDEARFSRCACSAISWTGRFSELCVYV